jgi:hypothetical protein
VLRNAVTVTNTSVPPSPKRARTGAYSSASVASGDGHNGNNSQSVGTGIDRSHAQVLDTVPERDSDEESEGYNELLIDTIARERGLKNVETHDATCEEDSTLVEHVSPSVGKNLPDIVPPLAPITPVVEKEMAFPVNGKNNMQMVVSYAAAVIGPGWTSEPVVTEVVNDVNMGDTHPDYFVQSPPSADRPVLTPEENVVPPRNEMRNCLRNPEGRMGSILEQAEAMSKKRNLEGIPSTSSSANAFDVLSNLDIMSRASLMGIDVPSDNFESIDMIKELEKARNNLLQKNGTSPASSFVVHHDHSRETPLSLTWLSSDELDDSFTVVSSRKSRKKVSKRNVTMSKPVTRSQKKGDISAQLPGRSARIRKTPDRFKC